MGSPCNSNTSGSCRAGIIPRMSEAVSRLRAIAIGWNPMTRPLIARTETTRVGDECARSRWRRRALVACIAMGLTRACVVTDGQVTSKHVHGASIQTIVPATGPWPSLSTAALFPMEGQTYREDCFFIHVTVAKWLHGMGSRSGVIQ